MSRPNVKYANDYEIGESSGVSKNRRGVMLPTDSSKDVSSKPKGQPA